MLDRFRRVLAIFPLMIGAFSASAGAEVHFYKLREDATPQLNDYSVQQHQTAWCWAACSEMAYRLHGAELRQEDVVAALRGDARANTPAYAEELARTLTALGPDRVGKLVSATAAVYKRDGAGNLTFTNPQTRQSARMNPLAQAFMLGYGIPTIWLYSPHGGATGHFVLVTGISIDDQTLRAVHYQIEDPWPLDERGAYVAANGHAVRRQIRAEELEQTAMACVVPFVITDASIEQMKAFTSRIQALEQLAADRRSFTWSKLDELAGGDAAQERFATPEEAVQSLVESRKDARGTTPGPSDVAAASQIRLSSSNIKWSTTADDPSARVTLEYKNTGTKTVKCKVTLASGHAPRDARKGDYSGWEMKYDKSFELVIPPGQKKRIQATISWYREESTMPQLRFPKGGEGDPNAEFLIAEFAD